MWDNQGPTPGTGDWPLHRSTVYAIEGGVRVSLPEWDGEPLQVMLEEDGLYTDGGLRFFAGRQTRWHVID
jgi:hypothetical protein